ncbi:MAG TPA: chemotaxis protein CheD [Beijerinckiaceae bacterium]|jgi:chemotaxis protein CheD
MNGSEGGARKIHVVQGEFRVSHEQDVVFSTLLGSCVAACVMDPKARVGGMNHFLLPGDASTKPQESERYGVHLMELLINELMKQGARRERLEAKLFGGATMMAGLWDIGKKNAEFARRFLDHEGIKVVNADLGGARGRRILYWPSTGKAQVAYMGAQALPPAEPVKPLAAAAAGEFESFS